MDDRLRVLNTERRRRFAPFAKQGFIETLNSVIPNPGHMSQDVEILYEIIPKENHNRRVLVSYDPKSGQFKNEEGEGFHPYSIFAHKRVSNKV